MALPDEAKALQFALIKHWTFSVGVHVVPPKNGLTADVTQSREYSYGASATPKNYATLLVKSTTTTWSICSTKM